MELTLYQVDAFADKLFAGNPAAVVPLTEWLPSETMQKIALENNLSETAFIIPEGEGYHIRWFTPAIEVDLCGHATLATAHIVFTELGFKGEQITFNSKSGILTVSKKGDLYTMNFPTDNISEMDIPKELQEIFGVTPNKYFKGNDDYMAIFEDQSVIENLKPDFAKMAQIKARGIIATAPGDSLDFVSRCFYPAAGINEDPVTGSAHTTMAPYWAKTLKKNTLSAYQLSARGGAVHCKYYGDRVDLSGEAITYLKGTIFYNSMLKIR